MIHAKLHAEGLLTSHEVGDLLQVNPSSVKKWVNEGRIAAHRTPGGHRRIRVSDLMQFLERQAMPIPRELSGCARRRLLIVDDDLVHLRALERRMKPFAGRVDVQVTDSGIEALVMVGDFKPQLVVLDVFMPELDGLEVCRRLKRRPATADIDVIVTSAHLTSAVEETALAAGATKVVPKPLDLQVLVNHFGLQLPVGL